VSSARAVAWTGAAGGRGGGAVATGAADRFDAGAGFAWCRLAARCRGFAAACGVAVAAGGAT
jgi:hypothetical protein